MELLYVSILCFFVIFPVLVAADHYFEYPRQTLQDIGETIAFLLFVGMILFCIIRVTLVFFGIC